MKRKTLAWFGAIAMFYENYILPWTSLAIIYGIFVEAHKHREQTLRLLRSFFSGELPPHQTSLFLNVPFLIALVTYNLALTLGLLIRKKQAYTFGSFREIFLPLAACFYFYIFNLAPFAPPAMNVNLLPAPLQSFFMIFGVTLMAAGFLISAAGIFSLGNSFAIFVETRDLVTRGIYRFTRHPVYFGHLLRAVGVCLATGTSFLIVTHALLIYLLVERALLEEERLRAHYPEYQAYTKKTPSFFLMLFGKDQHAHLNPAAIIPAKISAKRKIGWAVFLLLSFTIGTVAATYDKAQVGFAASKDGTPIFFSVRGKGEPTLVFVHGWGGDRTFWEKQAPYFKKKHRVVTLDLAGRGLSGRGRTVYSLRAFGEDVAAVIEKVRASEVILIGHSSGGPVIMETAAIMPGRVKALVGIDSLQNLETAYTPSQVLWREKPFREDYFRSIYAFVRALCLPGTDPKLMDEITGRMLETPFDAAISSMDEFLKISYVAHPPKINVPVWCLNSAMWPTALEINRKYLPDFNVRVMPDVGHFMMLEKPKEFNLQLDSILKEIEKQTGRN